MRLDASAFPARPADHKVGPDLLHFLLFSLFFRALRTHSQAVVTAEGGHLAGMSRLSHLVLPHHENILVAELWLLIYVGVANDMGLPHQGLRGRRLFVLQALGVLLLFGVAFCTSVRI